MYCAKFGWNWLRIFEKNVDVFSLFVYYLPLEWSTIPHLNKSESYSVLGLDDSWENAKLRKTLWQRQWWRQTSDKFKSEKLTWPFGLDKLINSKVNEINEIQQFSLPPLKVEILPIPYSINDSIFDLKIALYAQILLPTAHFKTFSIAQNSKFSMTFKCKIQYTFNISLICYEIKRWENKTTSETF